MDGFGGIATASAGKKPAASKDGIANTFFFIIPPTPCNRDYADAIQRSPHKLPSSNIHHIPLEKSSSSPRS
jgi:hypothetical protein